MAFELARRGRAKTVCEICPAGFWDEDWVERDRVFKLLLNTLRDTRRGRPSPSRNFDGSASPWMHG